LEDELDTVGTSEVQVLADELFEEEPTGERTVQDLGERELGLEDGEVVGVASGDVGLGEGCSLTTTFTMGRCNCR
jgi:hypothetical protein